MSLIDSRLNLKSLLSLKSNFVSICTAVVAATLILGAAKLVWSVPKPLLIFSGGGFFIWCGIYWWSQRRINSAVTFSAIFKHVAIILFTWTLIAGLFLSAIYRLDNAGWLWTQLTGYDVTLAEDHSDQIFASRSKFLGDHPSFELNPANPAGLMLPKGEHAFRETVVIPEGTSLVIQPGTTLRFGTGRSLISYSPIWAEGTEFEPIQFVAINPWFKWGVVGLVKTEKSHFAHVKFENSRQALVNGVEFFGGLSLIETDAEISDSRFANMYGKDAVYVKRSHVLVRNNIFHNTYKDCLDFDGGSGIINSNIFLICGDEGIDLSENFNVEVFDNYILSPDGGRISADNNLTEIISLNNLEALGE